MPNRDVELIFAEVGVHAITDARRAYGDAVREYCRKRHASRTAHEWALLADSGAHDGFEKQCDVRRPADEECDVRINGRIG